MKILALTLAVLILSTAGCSHTTSVRLPDGNRGFAIACAGDDRNWAKCYEAAGDKCGSRGYDIMNPGAEKADKSAGQSLLFKCKE